MLSPCLLCFADTLGWYARYSFMMANVNLGISLSKNQAVLGLLGVRIVVLRSRKELQVKALVLLPLPRCLISPIWPSFQDVGTSNASRT